MNKEALKVKTSSNARKSSWRVKGTTVKCNRGTPKFFLYLQERFGDLYCYIKKNKIFPCNLEDNFTKEDLIKCDKNFQKIKEFLFFESIKRKKKLTFSPNSEFRI